jgi:hypothetical protein
VNHEKHARDRIFKRRKFWFEGEAYRSKKKRSSVVINSINNLEILLSDEKYILIKQYKFMKAA